MPRSNSTKCFAAAIGAASLLVLTGCGEGPAAGERATSAAPDTASNSVATGGANTTGEGTSESIVGSGTAASVSGRGTTEGGTASTQTSGTAETASSAATTSESAPPTTESAATGTVVATASFAAPDGTEIGTFSIAQDGETMTVTAQATGLEPGFKGFHIHAIGKCEPDSPDPENPATIGNFLSAGGHLGGDDANHPGHAGDLSSLQVRADGGAELVTTTDALDPAALFDADGSAVMIHLGPDDFANIPTRYAAAPDQETLDTGDAGGRAACGVLEQAGA